MTAMYRSDYLGYCADIVFDPEDNIFVGEVTGLKDSLSFHGRTVEEAIEIFHQSIDNYSQMCEILGKAPDKVSTRPSTNI